MNFKEKTVLFLATGGYAGRVPFAPGTVGSLIGLVICYSMSFIALSGAALLCITLILLAVWVSEYAERILMEKDPGCVVIDEIVGMMVTLIGIPFSITTAFLGFVLFRLFDILKPPPIRNLQDGLPGGAGIVMDDVAAGIIGNVILRIICHVAGL